MALTPAQSAYLADLLTGIGTGLMSAPRNGPPLAGFSMGVQNANQLMAARRQQQDQDQERQFRAQQLARQQKLDAETDAAKGAAQKSLSQLLPVSGANASGFRNTGAGPMASMGVPPSTGGDPSFAALPAPLQTYITARGAYDPVGALDAFGQYATKTPEPPKLPKMESYEVDGMKVSGYWDPKDASQFVVMGKSPIKSGSEGTNVRWSLNPVYGQNDKGQTVLIVPNDQGGVKLADLPPGVTVAPQTQFLNTGTAIVAGDKRTGQMVPGAAALPIDNSGKATQASMGEAIAKAKQSVPAMTDAVANATAQIEAIKNDPALDWTTGWTGGLAQQVPGSPWKSLATRIDQLKGSSFLQARELLKGGGQITDYEGSRADQAMARMDTAQNSADFIQALDEFQTAIKQGLARMQYAAQGNFEQSGSEQFPMQTGPAASPPPPPEGFEVVQ